MHTARGNVIIQVGLRARRKNFYASSNLLNDSGVIKKIVKCPKQFHIEIFKIWSFKLDHMQPSKTIFFL